MKNEQNFKNALKILYKLHNRLSDYPLYQADQADNYIVLESTVDDYKNEVNQFTSYWGIPFELQKLIWEIKDYNLYGFDAIQTRAKGAAASIEKQILDMVVDFYLDDLKGD